MGARMEKACGRWSQGVIGGAEGGSERRRPGRRTDEDELLHEKMPTFSLFNCIYETCDFLPN